MSLSHIDPSMTTEHETTAVLSIALDSEIGSTGIYAYRMHRSYVLERPG